MSSRSSRSEMMYIIYIMKRTQIYLEEEQDAQLAKRAAAAGVTKSTLIRQALDDFLEGPSDEQSRRNRFLAAVEEVAANPLDLPAGAAYVEQVRAADIRRQQELDRRRR